MSSHKSQPLSKTYIGSLRDKQNDRTTIYYQSEDDSLYSIDNDGTGKPTLVHPQKRIQRHSPLSAVEYVRASTFPRPDHVFGKNDQSNIILVTTQEPDNLYTESAPGSGFAAIEHDDPAFYTLIHFQRESNKNEIVERLRAHEREDHVVAENADPHLQPIAASAVAEGFRSKYAVQTAKAKLLAKDPNAGVPIIGYTRYTVYHGNDDHIWLSETWDTGFGPDSFQQKVNNVRPQDIYNDKGSKSPLAIAHNGARLVIYYLNAQGTISRISLLYEQGWGKPTTVGENLKPLSGTNLAATVRFVGDFLHHHFLVAYQDKDNNIKTVEDSIIFNET